MKKKKGKSSKQIEDEIKSADKAAKIAEDRAVRNFKPASFWK
jgi:hypothetical protein